jgi:PAS domain S-box-containing protein
MGADPAMTLGLRGKILLITSIMVLAAVAAISLASGFFFTSKLIKAHIAQSQAIAEGLGVQLGRLVALGINVAELQGFEEQCAEAVRSNEGLSQAMVVSLDGKILFHSNPAHMSQPLRSPALLAGLRIQTRSIKDPEDHSYAAVTPVLDTVKKRVADIVVSFPQQVIDKERTDLLRLTLGVGMGALVCGLILLFLVLSHYVIRPITSLVEAIEPIRHGTQDYSIRVAVPSKDELGSLAEGFNEMLVKIQERDSELERHRERLEEKVKNRTAELERAYRKIRAELVERRQTEERLRASEAGYRNLFDSITDAIYLHDGEERFLDVNQGAEAMTGYSRNFLIGKTLETIGGNGMNDLTAVDQAVREAFAGRSQQLDFWGKRADGTIFPEEIRLIPATYMGTPVVMAIARDITERKQAEGERLKTQKLEAIGTLAGGIAHDFNNLLQGVFGYISMAKMCTDRQAQSYSLLEQAEKALELTISLTNQLLTFSKGGKPVRRRIDTRKVIENSAKFALSGSRSECRLVFADDLWPVEADEGQIGQVIQNIILNADQAMPTGGVITITTDNQEGNGSGTTHLPGPGRWVQIVISDTGLGISKEHLPRIFDPYFSTKQKGSGLGLATSYSIIYNHGGMIKAASEINWGSTFSIYLPAGETLVEKTPVGEALPAAPSSKILVMDDEAMVRDVVGKMLTRMGHLVDLAPDGETAIEMYQAAKINGAPFDLVILDVTVRGGMGGEEAIRHLKTLDPEVVAIVSSGYSDDAVVADYAAHGFKAFLPKPFNLQSLQAVLISVQH